MFRTVAVSRQKPGGGGSGGEGIAATVLSFPSPEEEEQEGRTPAETMIATMHVIKKHAEERALRDIIL